MPSRFRFFGSNSSESISPDIMLTTGHAPLDRENSPITASDKFEAPPNSPDVSQGLQSRAEPEDDNAGSGLHDVIKATEVWFNYQLSLLEKFAVTEAEEWAKAGIPRQDAPLEGELPIETSLKARAAEIFQEWVARTRRKVQDAVQASCTEGGAKMVQLRHAFSQLERSTIEIESTKLQIREREEALLSQQKTFGAEPILKRKWTYITLLLALSVIEWIANVPIFSELLPEEPGTRLIWKKLVADTQRMGAAGGLHRVIDKVLLYPDVAIFAFGLIIFLMVLAHFGGEAWRAWVVLNPEDEPLLAPTLRARRRHALIPICTSIAGIVFAITFLAASRARLEPAATKGYNQAQIDVQNLEVQQNRFNSSAKQIADVQQQVDLAEQLEAARAREKDWQERVRYARDIGMMNMPILLLNVVLALTALTASYCVAAPRVTEGKLIDPFIADLKSKLAELKLDSVHHRHVLRTLDAEIQTAISRSKYLAGTRPVAEWHAKVQRLNAVVSLFRAENARLRGIDPDSIFAFRQRSTLDLPSVSEEPFTIPVQLASIEEEFRELKLEFQAHNSHPAVPVGMGVMA